MSSNDSTLSSLSSSMSSSSTSPLEFNQPKSGSATELIELVKQYPELYDKNHKMYCNNTHKGVLWGKIAQKLDNGSAKKVREQFSYMRKRFKMEYDSRKRGIRLPLLPEPDSSNYRQPLFVYKQLAFLEPILDKENEMYQESYFPFNNETIIENDLLETLTSDSMENAVVVAPNETSNDGRKFQKRRRFNSPIKTQTFEQPPTSENAQLSSYSASTKPLTTTTPPSPSSTMDFPSFLQIVKTVYNHIQQEFDDEECKLIGQQVTMDCKSLDSSNFAIARYRINKLIMELELKQNESNDQPVLHNS